MRRKAQVDKNQPEIVATLRSFGITVAHTHMIGRGFPDIVCGYGGRTYLFEIKNENRPLNALEKKFHDEWEGHVSVIYDADDALYEIGVDNYDSDEL